MFDDLLKILMKLIWGYFRDKSCLSKPGVDSETLKIEN